MSRKKRILKNFLLDSKIFEFFEFFLNFFEKVLDFFWIVYTLVIMKDDRVTLGRFILNIREAKRLVLRLLVNTSTHEKYKRARLLGKMETLDSVLNEIKKVKIWWIYALNVRKTRYISENLDSVKNVIIRSIIKSITRNRIMRLKFKKSKRKVFLKNFWIGLKNEFKKNIR